MQCGISWSDTRVLWFVPAVMGWLPIYKVNWARLENPCRGWKGLFWYLPWPSPSSLASPSGFTEGRSWGPVRSGLWGAVVPSGQHSEDCEHSEVTAWCWWVGKSLPWRTFSPAEATFWNRPVWCREGWGSFGYWAVERRWYDKISGGIM